MHPLLRTSYTIFLAIGYFQPANIQSYGVFPVGFFDYNRVICKLKETQNQYLEFIVKGHEIRKKQ